MKNLNYIFNIIIRTIFFTIKNTLLFSLIYFILISNDFNNMLIMPITMFFYLLISFGNDLWQKYYYKSIIETKYFLIFIFIFTVASSILCFYKTSIIRIIIGVLYFIYISFDSIKRADGEFSIGVELTIFILLVFVAFSLLFSATQIYGDNLPLVAYGNDIMDIIFIYFIAAILYFTSRNFNTNYECANSINRYRKFAVFNFFSCIFLFIILFFKDKIILAISLMYEKCDKVVTFILNKMIYVSNYIIGGFMKWLYSDSKRALDELLPQETPEDLAKEIEEVKDIVENVETTGNLTVIYEIIMAVLLILFIVLLYKKIKSKTILNKSKANVEKEFIFKSDDLLKNIKSKINNLFTKKEELAPERLRYIKKVNILISKGYKIEKSTTPNEYICGINENDINENDFDKITDEYNTFRYGR